MAEVPKQGWAFLGAIAMLGWVPDLQAQRVYFLKPSVHPSERLNGYRFCGASCGQHCFEGRELIWGLGHCASQHISR